MASRLFSFSQRMKFIEKYQKIYHSANRKTKSGIIKLISETLGYHPKHIIRLLNNFEFSGDTDKTYKISGRGKKAEYNGIRDVIISLWNEVGCIWAERLKVFITENISWITEKYDLNQTQILLLNKISPSTIDRIVKHQRIRRKKYLFSRTRPYKKDDNAYIEQKNWTNVRKIIGFDRYEGEKKPESF